MVVLLRSSVGSSLCCLRSGIWLCHLSVYYMALPLLASGLPQFCETCCPCGLHWLISGLLAGGSPGFRSVLCWFLHLQSFVLFCLVWPPSSNPQEDTMDDTMLSPFFQLRRSFVVVCFEVTIGELLCLIGLRHVISGILAGGIPGFRIVLLLLHSPSGMAWWFWCSSLCFCRHTMSRWYNVIISCMN